MRIDCRHALCFGLLVLLAACGGREPEPYVHFTDGVLVTLNNAAAKKVRLTVVSPKIIRVTAFPKDDTQLQPSLMVAPPRKDKEQTPFELSHDKESVTIKTGDVTAVVTLA